MHNLAIALHKNGHMVTGSDDVIFEPSLSRLSQYGLLPSEFGWDPGRIQVDMDAVIVGMHAKVDNPELIRAKELSIPTYSFPAFVFEQSKQKLRVVVAGSHGKTTCTAMIMHVLAHAGLRFDYLVGSSVDGFEDSVRLSDAPIIVLEGDEYLSSPFDLRPKFVWYKPNVLMLTGIAWDHINVFPTKERYVAPFEQLVAEMTEGTLVYFSGDAELRRIVGGQFKPSLIVKPYETPKYFVSNGRTTVVHEDLQAPLLIFGEHNLQNLEGVRLVCAQLGVPTGQFFEAMTSFAGAGRRLQPLVDTPSLKVFKDFAHSPSKVAASVNAVASQYPDHHVVAVLELFTFSSLNPDFLPQYANTLAPAGTAAVFVDPEALRRKGNLQFTQVQIRDAFKRPDLLYFDNPTALEAFVPTIKHQKMAFVLMSSGNWGGLAMDRLLGMD